MTDEEKKDVQNFFKRCVVTKERKEVEQKLRETKEYRRELIENSLEDYKKMWDFYFIAPDLVRQTNLFLYRNNWLHWYFRHRFCMISKCFLKTQILWVFSKCGQKSKMKQSINSIFALTKTTFLLPKRTMIFWNFSHSFSWFRPHDQLWKRPQQHFLFILRYFYFSMRIVLMSWNNDANVEFSF